MRGLLFYGTMAMVSSVMRNTTKTGSCTVKTDRHVSTAALINPSPFGNTTWRASVTAKTGRLSYLLDPTGLLAWKCTAFTGNCTERTDLPPFFTDKTGLLRVLRMLCVEKG
tara:strand:- start:6783 stop:7115 length:333 start_codon:yes stop_codon:yes gene_type:complete